MNTFELEIWDNEGSKTTFYTVRWANHEHSETDKFFGKYYHKEEYKEASQQLMSLLIDSIGEDHGAIAPFFNRTEDNAYALPPHGRLTIKEVTFHFPRFPLRLYALRVFDRKDLVILFNGGAKTAQTNQESKDLYLKFIEAKRFAKRIEEELREELIVVDEENRRLVTYSGDNEIFIG